MLRRLTYILAALALLVSVAVGSMGAARSLAMDLPGEPNTIPPGLTSTGPAAGKLMDASKFDLASGEPEDPTGKGIPG